MKWSRKLTSAVLRVMPRPIRHTLIRRAARIVDAELATVEAVRIASTIDEYVDAMGLVYDGYVNRGIMAPHDSRVRMTHYLALPTTIIFVALENGKVAGTVSLVKDSLVGLPMQKIYGAEIQAIRDEGRVPAEVGALCVTGTKRGTGIPFLLYKAMFSAARDLLGLDDLVIAVHPDAADLYAATLQFEQIGPVRSYPALDRSALAVALRLRVKEAQKMFEEKWSHLPPTSANPYWLYVQRVDKQIQLPTDPSVLDELRNLHDRAAMKLAALRPDIVLALDTNEFKLFRREMMKKPT